MNKKIFEAMRIGIFEMLREIKEMIFGLMRFLMGMLILLFPLFAIVMIARCIFSNSPDDQFACCIVLCGPAIMIGAALVGELQHICRAIQYVEEHDCDIKEALEATNYSSDPEP